MAKHTNSKPKSIQNLDINQQSTERTANMCVHITVYKCHTPQSTEQF